MCRTWQCLGAGSVAPPGPAGSREAGIQVASRTWMIAVERFCSEVQASCLASGASTAWDGEATSASAIAPPTVSAAQRMVSGKLLLLEGPLRVLAEAAVLAAEALRRLLVPAKLPLAPAHRGRGRRSTV